MHVCGDCCALALDVFSDWRQCLLLWGASLLLPAALAKQFALIWALRFGCGTRLLSGIQQKHSMWVLLS